MTTTQIIELAAKHADKNESARICLADARLCFKQDDKRQYAAGRALDSLKHSVGIFHPDYKAAKALA